MSSLSIRAAGVLFSHKQLTNSDDLFPDRPPRQHLRTVPRGPPGQGRGQRRLPLRRLRLRLRSAGRGNRGFLQVRVPNFIFVNRTISLSRSLRTYCASLSDAKQLSLFTSFFGMSESLILRFDPSLCDIILKKSEWCKPSRRKEAVLSRFSFCTRKRNWWNSELVTPCVDSA